MAVYLNKKEEKELELMNPEEYQKYYRYARSLYEQTLRANLSVEERKRLYPVLYRALKLMNRINRNKIKTIGNKMKFNEKPRIYAVTHIGKLDIEMMCEALKEHTYILSGDFENLHRTLSGSFLELNGIIYVNENDKEDRKLSKENMVRILRSGGNIMYFPEGTWNMSESLPVLKLFPGIIEVALLGGAEIIPVAIEQYGHKFVANIGENMDVLGMYADGMSVDELKDTLRDLMAALKWEIYESVPKWDKDNIPDGYYQKFLDDRMAEWPGFTLEEVLSKEYKDKSIVTPDEAFAHLKKLKICRENAFLLRK